MMRIYILFVEIILIHKDSVVRAHRRHSQDSRLKTQEKLGTTLFPENGFRLPFVSAFEITSCKVHVINVRVRVKYLTEICTKGPGQR